MRYVAAPPAEEGDTPWIEESHKWSDTVSSDIMGDYNLSGLSSRSFEQLVQAIAGQVLGLGLVTFGDGPDGGREATFQGRMDFPSKAEPWDGYCVVQAKFRQRPQGTTRDGGWALRQLEKELEAFADTKKGRRLPEYYIFATNVVLTPAARKGTKDRVAALFEKYGQKVPIRGWRVWDFDEIGRFLDDLGEIRRAYSAWITPGDVLAAILEQLESPGPDFLEAMTTYLSRELLRDQYANLEQAGHAAQEKVLLSRVFVDLPVTLQRTAEPPPEENGDGDEGRQGRPATELAAELVERSRDRLDPESTLAPGPSREGRESAQHRPLPGRYVLVGGPGQGKTTVGQFLCQLFRASLLEDRPPHLLSQETRDALEAIGGHCEAGRLELPKARRFPIRLVLSEFASALNAEPELSLLRYVARTLASRSDRDVSSETLRRWLAAYPWLLVLDGLDEVPASSNRDAVLQRVEDFWGDAAQANADLLVLATTRPQGYNDDFSPSYYRHLWLAPLSPARALAYARRLVKGRHAGDEDRQQKILRRLDDAAGQEATVRLMSSPLQITIMATLVDQVGPPPQDRWQLFRDYYDVIYRRERERPIATAAILRDYRADIDAIHTRVGLLLQLSSEMTGGTEAKLPADRFASLVEARLQEEGHEGEELAALRDRIIEAAANRLVFLVGLEAGQVGFEIRSLQEFMAAEAIMAGPQDRVQDRLRRFAPAAVWRNVFLFAAGRCFSSPRDQHLRDTIYTICEELDDDLAGPVGKAIRAGSVLALELLEDGVARRQPKYARLLAQCACRLLELPPVGAHIRLADVCHGAIEDLFKETLAERLRAEFPGNLSAWATLLALFDREVGWAQDLADTHWPERPGEQLEILSLASAKGALSWLDPRLPVTIRGSSLSNLVSMSWGVGDQLEDRAFPANLTALMEMLPLGRYVLSRRARLLPSIRATLIESSNLRIQLSLQPLDRIQENWNRLEGAWKSLDLSNEDRHPSWLLLAEGRYLAQDLCADRLAVALHRLAGAYEHQPSERFLHLVPWPLAACMGGSSSAEGLERLSQRAAQGDLGDLESWMAAEERWARSGVTQDDLVHLAEDGWPFDKRIHEIGFPLLSSVLHLEHRRLGETSIVVEGFFRLLSYSQDAPHVRRFLAGPLLDLLSDGPTGNRTRPPLDPEALLGLLEGSLDGRRVGLSTVRVLSSWAKDDPGWLDLLELIGREARLYSHHVGPVDYSELFSELRSHAERPGTLPLLAAVVAADSSLPRTSLPSVRPEDYTDAKIRWAALTLEIARGDLSRHRAEELAAITCELARDDAAWIIEVAYILREMELLGECAAHYLLEVRRGLGPDAVRGHTSVVWALKEALRRQGSGASSREVWAQLGLPTAMLELLPSSSEKRRPVPSAS